MRELKAGDQVIWPYKNQDQIWTVDSVNKFDNTRIYLQDVSGWVPLSELKLYEKLPYAPQHITDMQEVAL